MDVGFMAQACHMNLRQIADLALVAQREHSNFVLLHHEAIQRDVARVAKRDDQLANVTFDASSHEGMRRKVVDGALNCIGSRKRARGIFG